MKTIEELWKELEDLEFSIFVAQKSKNEDKIPALKRKMKAVEKKIKEQQSDENI